MSDDLSKMIPTPRQVKTASGFIEVKPIKMGQLPSVLKSIQPFQHFFSGNYENMDHSLVFELVAQHSEAVMDFMAAATRKDRAVIEALEMDESVELLVAVLETNLDFFINRVLPLLSGGMERFADSVRARTPQPGQTASKS